MRWSSVIGAALGLLTAVPVSWAIQVKPGYAPGPGPAAQVAPSGGRGVSAASAPASRGALHEPVSEPSSSSPSTAARSLDVRPFAVVRGASDSPSAVIRIPMFAGRPMGKRLQPCQHDESVFSYDCNWGR